MKNNAKKILYILGGMMMTCLFLVAIFGLTIQKSPNTENSENDKIINVVKAFWEFAENGKSEEAKALTTNSYKGLVVEVKKQEATEEWIHEYNLSYISANMHHEPNDNKCVVRVKVKGKDKDFYLFHDLVKDDRGEWKILSTSY